MGDMVGVGGRSKCGDMGNRENQGILVLFGRYASAFGTFWGRFADVLKRGKALNN